MTGGRGRRRQYVRRGCRKGWRLGCQKVSRAGFKKAGAAEDTGVDFGQEFHMGAIEDVRKVIQDLVAPELKSLHVQIKGVDDTSSLRDEALSAKIDSRRHDLSTK